MSAALPPDEPALALQPLGDLLNKPVVPLDYVWSGRLVSGTVSILVAKPKAGKSTLARNLCLAVARGESFLGWQCKQGAAVYAVLEERVDDVVADFRNLGAETTDPIFLCGDSYIDSFALCGMVREKRPALVIVDPLQRLTRVKDGQSYAENYNALGLLVDAARESNSHLLLLHHSAKIEREDSVDSPLGSTALAGAVSTVLRMRRTASFRTLSSVQRLGPDLEETILSFDPQSKRLACGELRETFELESLGERIMAALKETALSEPDLLDGIEAGAKLKRRELRKLVAEGKIQRSGTGKRGDPFLYEKKLVCSSESTEKISDEKLPEGPEQGVASGEEKKARPAIFSYKETSGRETSKAIQTPINSGEKLVPTLFEKDELSGTPGRAFFPSEKVVIPGASVKPDEGGYHEVFL